MKEFARKLGAMLLVAEAAVLLVLGLMLLSGCDGPIAGRTIAAPYGLEIVELDTGGFNELCPDSATHIYHVREQGASGTLTWGGQHSFAPLRPFTPARFEEQWPGLLARLGKRAGD